MSEEMKKLLWELKQYLVPYSPNWNTLCDIEQYILNLQQQNKDLKEQLKGTTHCYDEAEHKKLKEEHKIMKQILIEHGLWEELLNDNRFLNYLRKDDKDYKSSFCILTEFEKWLEDEYSKSKNKTDIFHNFIGIKECLNKLQELKGNQNASHK